MIASSATPTVSRNVLAFGRLLLTIRSRCVKDGELPMATMLCSPFGIQCPTQGKHCCLPLDGVDVLAPPWRSVL